MENPKPHRCKYPGCRKKLKYNYESFCTREHFLSYVRQYGKLSNGIYKYDVCQGKNCDNSITHIKKTRRKFCGTSCKHNPTIKKNTKGYCQREGCINRIKNYGAKRKYCSKKCNALERKFPDRYCVMPGCSGVLKRLSKRFCSHKCIAIYRWMPEEERIKLSILPYGSPCGIQKSNPDSPFENLCNKSPIFSV